MPTIEGLTAPGKIFQRILSAVSFARADIHLDGSADYQRGFIEGMLLAERIIKSEEGNLACEVTALAHREMTDKAPAV